MEDRVILMRLRRDMRKSTLGDASTPGRQPNWHWVRSDKAAIRTCLTGIKRPAWRAGRQLLLQTHLEQDVWRQPCRTLAEHQAVSRMRLTEPHTLARSSPAVRLTIFRDSGRPECRYLLCLAYTRSRDMGAALHCTASHVDADADDICWSGRGPVRERVTQDVAFEVRAIAWQE